MIEAISVIIYIMRMLNKSDNSLELDEQCIKSREEAQSLTTAEPALNEVKSSRKALTACMSEVLHYLVEVILDLCRYPYQSDQLILQEIEHVSIIFHLIIPS